MGHNRIGKRRLGETHLKYIARIRLAEMIFREDAEMVRRGGLEWRYQRDGVLPCDQLLRVVLVPHIFQLHKEWKLNYLVFYRNETRSWQSFSQLKNIDFLFSPYFGSFRKRMSLSRTVNYIRSIRLMCLFIGHMRLKNWTL